MGDFFINWIASFALLSRNDNLSRPTVIASHHRWRGNPVIYAIKNPAIAGFWVSVYLTADLSSYPNHGLNPAGVQRCLCRSTRPQLSSMIPNHCVRHPNC